MLGESKKLLTTNHMRNFICTGSAGEDRGLAVQRAGGQGNADHIFCKQRVDRTPG